MDRRKFLLNSAALAAGAMTHELAHGVTLPGPQQEHSVAPPVMGATPGSDRTPFTWETSLLVFSFEFDEDRLRLRHILPAGVAEPPRLPAPNMVSGLETSLHCTGEDIPDHHGAKLCGGSPGIRMRFVRREETVTAKDRQLLITHEDVPLGLRVESIYESLNGISVVRRSTKVINISDKPVGIEYVSSAMLNNFASPDTFQQDLWIHFAHNSWQAEAQWGSVRPSDLGLLDNGNFTVSGASFSAVGSWPCQSYLPMMMVENERSNVIWFWQVEHNGSWHCEIAQTSVRALYAYLGGPDAQHAQAWKMLKPGETYKSVPIAIGCVRGGFERAVAELTRYRRATLLHPRRDMRECPVVFNDAVVLGGDISTAKEIPLIDSASAVGCEVFCLDAGWSSRPGENWWGAVGDWEPNRNRFPGGFKELIGYVRKKGMVPGLWIEPEVASPQSNIAKASDAWFFMRHGKRVLDHSRYHMDFRNPDVRAYIDRIFDRLIGDFGIGYIKLDYNINALEGTETRADSFGQGLLEHNRAFLEWMDTLLDRYPELTIETVASGSMRMEYSVLSRAQLQSISDQGDFRLYSSITTGCSAAILPEQMGVWSVPARGNAG